MVASNRTPQFAACAMLEDRFRKNPERMYNAIINGIFADDENGKSSK